MQSLAPIVTAIRNDLARAARTDKRAVEHDIRARRHDADAGLKWAKARTRIRAECHARQITEGDWCKQRLGCHISTMQRRVQLAKHFAEYERRRRGEGSNGQWGLEHALSLIPVNQRYAMNSLAPRDRRQSVTTVARAGEAALDLTRCEFISEDAFHALRKRPSKSVQCIITSPPFWPFRREFGGKGVGIGFEPTFAAHLGKLMAVFAECKRVLKSDGIMWVEYGDAYSHSGGQWRLEQMNKRPVSNKELIGKDVPMLDTTGEFAEKTQMLIPQRIAIALLDAGWLIRSNIIWDKGFARPDSALDRPTVSHSNIYMLVKQARYSYNIDPTRTPTMQGRLGSLPGHKKQGVIRRDLATGR
jgi:hypothetical protein